MATTNQAGLSRVTLVAPRTRIDLAIPADVPLADLLPTLLRYAGDDLADDRDATDGWALSRLGGKALDGSRTPAQLDVRDGELLYLRPRGDEAAMLVFDDVVDAVATAISDRPGRWRPATSRAFGLALGVLALLGGVAAVLLAGPPQSPGALIGLGLAVALLATSVVSARALGDSRTGTALALIGCVYAAAGGLLIAAGERTLDQLAAPHVLIAVSVTLVALALAAVGVADSAPVFLGAAIVAVAGLVIATICVVFGAGPPAAATIVATIAFAALPMMPMMAYRLARLPFPSVPADPEALKRDAESVDGSRVLALSGRADAFFSGMLGALAVIVGGTAVLAATAGLPGIVLCGVLGLLLMARARWFLGRAQRLPLLAAGAIALAAGTVAVYLTAGLMVRLTAILAATVMLAGLSIAFGIVGGARRSPVWGRLLDIAEIVLILALVPLALWLSGLYEWIRTIRG